MLKEAALSLAVVLLLPACVVPGTSSQEPVGSASSTASTSVMPASPTSPPTPTPEPGAFRDCTVDLVLTGALDLHLSGLIPSQLGMSGQPDAWHIQTERAEAAEVEVLLADGGALPMWWKVLASDRHSTGAAGPIFNLYFRGDLTPQGVPTTAISLFWAEDGLPDLMPPGAGTVEWDSPFALRVDLAFTHMEAESHNPAITGLPDGEVSAVGSIVC